MATKKKSVKKSPAKKRVIKKKLATTRSKSNRW